VQINFAAFTYLANFKIYTAPDRNQGWLIASNYQRLNQAFEKPGLPPADVH
jgi:hypothetical protein